MRVDQFDFNLPEECIALRPAVPRDSARMLVVRQDASIEQALVRDLPAYLRTGDMMVVNDTQVIRARLHGRRAPRQGLEVGPKIEILLHKRVGSAGFRAFARPARKLSIGDMLRLGEALDAQVIERGDGGDVELRFTLAGAVLDAAIAREGEIPLPPYIAGKRKADSRDGTDYQTIFARHPGSVAAPTAALHFTPELIARLAAQGVAREALTLHVGAGTFLPVSADDTASHHMHSEWAALSADAASRVNSARRAGGRIVAVGTTSLRTLESAADETGQVRPFSGETHLFITPGYRFKAVDALLTNFHLPRSTLFMLVCAFAGTETMKKAYALAIAEHFRFFSYGDACLLLRTPQ